MESPLKATIGRTAAVGLCGLVGAGALLAGCGLTGVQSNQSSTKSSPTTRKAGATSFATVPYQPTTTTTTATTLATAVAGAGGDASGGAAPAPGDIPATADAPGSYTVRAGDVAVLIARKNAVTFAELQQANPDKDLNRIVPGDTLVIPPPSQAGETVPPVGSPSQSSTASSTARSTTTAAAAKTGATYTVQSGDTLVGIAKKIGIQLATLQQLNPGVTPNSLQVGQKLNIPKGSSAKAPTTTVKP